MNRIRLNTLLVLLLMGTLLYAQPQGQTPADGETYYIYNVAKKMYLANDGNGKLTLSATGMGVTLKNRMRAIGNSIPLTAISVQIFSER